MYARGKKYLGILTSLIHESNFDGVDEIPIQCTVNYEIYTFLNAIPYLVHMFVFGGNLESCRDPDAIYGDVDSCDKNSYPYLEPHGFLAVREENRNSVDNDLEQKLDLKCPCCNCLRLVYSDDIGGHGLTNDEEKGKTT